VVASSEMLEFRMQGSSVEHMTSRNKEAEIRPMQVHHHFDASLAKAERRAELDE
jgi:hypothetical protein